MKLTYINHTYALIYLRNTVVGIHISTHFNDIFQITPKLAEKMQKSLVNLP